MSDFILKKFKIWDWVEGMMAGGIIPSGKDHY